NCRSPAGQGAVERRCTCMNEVGLPNPLPPSAGPDWGLVQVADPLFLGSAVALSAPTFLSVSPIAPPVVPWCLAGLGAEPLPAWLSVPSSSEIAILLQGSISLSFGIAPSSALIIGSLTPSVIGDRPSHPIYGDLTPPVRQCSFAQAGNLHSSRFVSG